MNIRSVGRGEKGRQGEARRREGEEEAGPVPPHQSSVRGDLERHQEALPPLPLRLQGRPQRAGKSHLTPYNTCL